MGEHSPEPWGIRPFPEGMEFDGYFRIVDSEGRHVATVPSSAHYGKPVGDGPPNAARIVACVNALAGVPDECLEGAGQVFKELLTCPVSVTANDPNQQPMAELLGVYLNEQRNKKRQPQS